MFVFIVKVKWSLAMDQRNALFANEQENDGIWQMNKSKTGKKCKVNVNNAHCTDVAETKK